MEVSVYLLLLLFLIFCSSDDQLKEEDAAEDASKDTETSGAHDDEVPTELNDQDNAATLPEYTYPKHIISELTQE